MIKNFKPRLYQELILGTAAAKNTLVVLPTGLGKTNIFLLLAAQRLKQYPNSKILLLGPTRPLISQYYSVFKKHFEINEDEMCVLTGMVKPEKRIALWENSKVIFSTPQGLENDIISSKIKLDNVSLIGFDEAHKAVGDYAYVFIAKEYNKKSKYPRIMALTASPGSDVEKIKEVIGNLFIEAIEARTDNDADVRQYIKEVKIKWVYVDLPQEFNDVLKYLKECYKSKIKEIKKYGYISSIQMYSENKVELLRLQAALQGEISKGNRDFALLKSISLAAEALKVEHAIELAETQGIGQLLQYLENLNSMAVNTKTKALKNLVMDINFRSALIKAKALYEKKIEHPKLDKLKEIIKKKLSENKEYKIIVFSQYRDTGKKIAEALNESNIKAEVFVGQAKKNGTGMSQKEQINILNDFRENKFNVLVSSSVGEEGLDIPQVDLVLFYEPVPSAIRYIQRKGRTGRSEKGEVIILMAKNTRDIGYKWSAFHKEKRMHRAIEQVKKSLGNIKYDQSLEKYIPEDEKPVVFVDYREKGSRVMKEIINNGVSIRLKSLKVGDYICSYRCCIEYKKVDDFVNSLIDGRLLEQLKSMKDSFERPIVIIEGTQDIYSVRNVHPNAIQGMIAAITLSYNIPIIHTKNAVETASIIKIMAAREKEMFGKDYSFHADKKSLTEKQQQEYIVSSFPGIGPRLAKPLLVKFRTIKNIVNANEKELKDVELIGEKKAKDIVGIVNKEYGE